MGALAQNQMAMALDGSKEFVEYHEAPKVRLDSAGRNAKLSAAARVLIIPTLTPVQKRLRKRLEKDDKKWMHYFFPKIFRQPFGDVHDEILSNADYAIETGGRCF